MKKYIISRTSVYEGRPHELAKKETLTKIHKCKLKTLSEVQCDSNACRWFYREGMFNHREEDGYTACDQLCDAWIIEISSIEELCKKEGELIIKESEYKEYPIEIEIYDDWRE